jgi:signal transduction histidine kinase
LKPILARSNTEAIIKAKESVMGMGYPSELRQVVMNLIINAKDAIEGKRSGSQGKITITISQDKTNVTITVADNGGGIPQDVMDRLFTPYSTTKDNGTGIGLYIYRFMMEKMGGSITVENKGRGAMFTLTLSRAKNV